MTVGSSGPLGLSLREFQELQRAFRPAGAGDTAPPTELLDCETFLKTLLQISPVAYRRAKAAGAERQYEEDTRALFKKIDAACAGAIGWRDITNFALYLFPVYSDFSEAVENSSFWFSTDFIPLIPRIFRIHLTELYSFVSVSNNILRFICLI